MILCVKLIFRILSIVCVAFATGTISGGERKDYMTTLEKIRKLCADNNVCMTKLETSLGFGNGSISKPKNILSDRLYAIAKYFGVSMEYLIDESIDDVDYMSDREKKLIEDFRALSDDGRDYICQTMELAASHYKK